MELKEKTLASELVFNGCLLKIYRDEVELADGGASVREVVHHPGEGNVYLERHFRYPYHKVVTEIPAGKLEPGENPAHAIRRELQEEIGATAGRWDSLGHIMPSVGYTDEMLYLFLARDLTFGERHLDQDEFLEPFKMPFAEALSQAASGQINDANTLAALYRAGGEAWVKKSWWWRTSVILWTSSPSTSAGRATTPWRRWTARRACALPWSRTRT